MQSLSWWALLSNHLGLWLQRKISQVLDQCRPWPWITLLGLLMDYCHWTMSLWTVISDHSFLGLVPRLNPRWKEPATKPGASRASRRSQITWSKIPNVSWTTPQILTHWWPSRGCQSQSKGQIQAEKQPQAAGMPCKTVPQSCQP